MRGRRKVKIIIKFARRINRFMRSQPHQQIAIRFLRAKCASPFGPRSSPESLTMNDQDAKRFPELYLNSAKYSLPTPSSQFSLRCRNSTASFRCQCFFRARRFGEGPICRALHSREPPPTAAILSHLRLLLKRSGRAPPRRMTLPGKAIAKPLSGRRERKTPATPPSPISPDCAADRRPYP